MTATKWIKLWVLKLGDDDGGGGDDDNNEDEHRWETSLFTQQWFKGFEANRRGKYASFKVSDWNEKGKRSSKYSGKK